ncbi:MAG: hypothetical protein HFF62_12455 [Oscillospiraceae bacterium]|nr:hypothetical protein [Oscillospiraceae bacterium]
MSGFKDMLNRDIHKVFLNVDEFAERRTVKYDGETYDGPEHEGIPVVLIGPVDKEREQLKDDHVQGLHLVTHTLYCVLEDLGGKLPKQGKSIQINTREGGKFFRKYYIAASALEVGMLHVELEEMDD